MIRVNDFVNYNTVKKIWSGQHKVPMYSPNVSIGQVILSALLKNPQRVAQINDNNGVTITNKDLHLRTIRAAQNLSRMGYKKGHVFGIVAGNHHELSAIVFAALTLGTPVNVLHPSFSTDEICILFKRTKPKIIFCSIDNVQMIKEVIRKLEFDIRIYVFGSESINELIAPTGIEHCFVPPDIGDGTKMVAVYLCSSGSSGFPKSLGLSHALLLNDLSEPMSTNEITFLFSTLYWYTGWHYLINGTLNGSTRIQTTESFEPSLMLKIISKHKVTNFLSPPASFAAFLELKDIEDTNLSSLKYVCICGSIAPVKITMQLKKLLPNACIANYYGLSEVGTIAKSLQEHPNGSVGIIKNDMELKIVDDNGCEMGADIDGELYCKTTYTFLGYVGDEQATNETLDSDGWIHTGDVGHFDENGYLYVVDRKKDILKYKNYQISPSEIERLIRSTFPINNVCVVGIQDIEIGSDLPAAFIIKTNDVNITEHDIEQIMAEKLSDAKQLRGGVYFIDAFPMTPSGKILRRELRKVARQLYLEKNK